MSYSSVSSCTLWPLVSISKKKDECPLVLVVVALCGHLSGVKQVWLEVGNQQTEFSLL